MRSAIETAGRVLAVAALLGALSYLTGCGDGALGAQIDALAVAGIVWSEADTLLVRERARELDSILDEARTSCGDDGCEAAEADAFRARLASAEQHWTPVLACREPIPEMLREWHTAIGTAMAARSSSGATVGNLLALGLRFIAVYAAFRRCVTALDPDIDLPALPAELVSLDSGGES